MALPDAKLPNSSAIAYATGDDLVERIDYRAVADLIYDDNTRPADAATTAADDKVEAALRAASGYIEMSATRGGRYAPEDLRNMNLAQVIPTAQGGNGTDTAVMVGSDVLKWMTCWLAYKMLFIRRFPSPRKEDLEVYKELDQILEDLRNGEEVFPFLVTQQAGLPSVVDMTTGMAAQAYRPITQNAAPFFGPYGNRRYE